MENTELFKNCLKILAGLIWDIIWDLEDDIENDAGAIFK